jgi:hypothetical protein
MGVSLLPLHDTGQKMSGESENQLGKGLKKTADMKGLEKQVNACIKSLKAKAQAPTLKK